MTFSFSRRALTVAAALIAGASGIAGAAVKTAVTSDASACNTTDAESCLVEIQAVLDRHKPTTTTSEVPSSTTTGPATSTTSSVPSTTSSAPLTTTSSAAPTTTSSTPTSTLPAISSTSSPSTSTTIPPPSGWPDASNTGWRHAPGCPNGLTSTLFDGTIQSNTTYSCVNFSDGAWVGTPSTPVSNVTFYGCLFKARSVEGALVVVFGDNITFDYSSFEPAVVAPPTPYADSYQYGISADGSYGSHVGKLTVSHSDFWGFGNAIDVNGSTQAKPQVFRDNWIHDAAADGGSYHTDGIGSLSGSGRGSYVVIDHNTIVSPGNTNGLAFQQGVYDHFTVTRNLFSGFGYTVAIWWPGTYTTFTDNTYSTAIRQTYGPLYNNTFATSTGSLWRRNRWLVPTGAQWGDPAHNGWFWMPSGGSINTSDNGYVSQTDFTG